MIHHSVKKPAKSAVSPWKRVSPPALTSATNWSGFAVTSVAQPFEETAVADKQWLGALPAENALSVRTTHVFFEPLDFLARLAALVPKSRVNLTGFHGFLRPTVNGARR